MESQGGCNKWVYLVGYELMLHMCHGTYVCQWCVSRDQGNNVAIFGAVSVLVVCVCAFLLGYIHMSGDVSVCL